MKIKYEFVTGEVIEIEVDEEIGMEIQTDRRREASYERKMCRWCYSLDAVDDKSSWYVDCNWNEDRDGGEELRNRKHKE